MIISNKGISNNDEGDPVELRDLKVFQAIAEEGSISRAAEQLGYVQSNVTARLRNTYRFAWKWEIRSS